MPEVLTSDAALHVEVDGEGDPVTILAHGITNSCRELAQLTPLFPGSKVRFCFRGHGHSSAPERGYRFADPVFSLLFLTFDSLPWIRLTSRGVWDVRNRRVLSPSTPL